MQRQLGAVQPHEAFVKVPEITVAFWVIKILTTGMGETTSDFFVRSFDPPPVVAAAGVLLAIALGAQILSRRYSTWLYWLTVVLVSIFGTMVADVLHILVGIPYLASTIGFGVALAVILFLWNRNEGTLSIHSISTRRRETFYWATVLATFALGTAAGDLVASSFGLGYLLSGVAFSVVFALPFVLRQGGRLGEVASFWTAYIVTRPLGASFADWIGVSRDRGGLNWGTGWVSLAIAIVVVLTICCSQRATKERK